MSEVVQQSESEKKKEYWMNNKWRPAMGWLYMLVCLCDFVLFPVLWSVMHAVLHTGSAVQWNPLTLQGAGLFHLAMGAVLGIAAMGRTQEKLAGANNGGALSTSNFMPSFGSNQSTPAPSCTPTPAPRFTPAPPPAFGGRPSGPAAYDHPEL